MALLNCPACMHEISDISCWCPHCGLPKEYYAPKVLDTALYEPSLSSLHRNARGYRKKVPITQPQIKKIYLLGGKCIEAKYYNENLMIISSRKVLGSLLGTVFSEDEPLFTTMDIPIISRKLPEHGVGQLIGAYKSGDSIRVVIRFEDSTLLKRKPNKNTYWDIEQICDENLDCLAFPNDWLKEHIAQNTGSSISAESLDRDLVTLEEQRLAFLSEQKGRTVYQCRCPDCWEEINSADNDICDICGIGYVCNACGYCTHCHADPVNDPAKREARIYSRLSEDEWEKELQKCEDNYVEFLKMS